MFSVCVRIYECSAYKTLLHTMMETLLVVWTNHVTSPSVGMLLHDLQINVSFSLSRSCVRSHDKILWRSLRKRLTTSLMILKYAPIVRQVLSEDSFCPSVSRSVSLWSRVARPNLWPTVFQVLLCSKRWGNLQLS